jgi:adenylate cyclase class 2
VGQKTEIEVKLRASDAESLRESLRQLGARVVHERVLEDNVLLDDDGGRLASAGRALRVRRVGGRGILTFKGNRRTIEGVKSREETELTVSDPDAMQSILQELGLRPRFRYQKYRETWQWQNVELLVDETPLGTFLEIEGALADVHRTAKALGRTPADYISDSYPSLWAASGRGGDMVFA